MELYGKVNVPTKQKQYTGAKTSTAIIDVNNESGIISVDITNLKKKLIINTPNADPMIYDGSTTVEMNLPSKSQIGVYTLSALNWINDTYVLSVIGKTASNNASVSIWQGDVNTPISDLIANKDAVTDANLFIVDTGTTLTFKCETTPTVDLKIQVEVFE